MSSDVPDSQELIVGKCSPGRAGVGLPVSTGSGLGDLRIVLISSSTKRFSPCGRSVSVGCQVWKGYFIPLFSSWGILGRLRI